MSRPSPLLLVVLAVALGVVNAAEESIITIGASPSRFDLEIGKRPVNEALRIFNYGSEPARIRVSVHPWTLDDRNEVQLVEPTEQSLDQWMIVSPVAFEVMPGAYQTVRFSIRPRVEPEPGEHRAMIYLQQQPTEGVVDGQTVRIIGRLGVAVYGYVGNVQRLGRLHEVEVRTEDGAPVASFDISSIGTAHVRMSGRYTVWPADRYPGAAERAARNETTVSDLDLPEGAVAVGWLPPKPVLPASRRLLPMRFGQDLPAGEYILDVRGELGEERLELGVPFSVSEASSEEIVSN